MASKPPGKSFTIINRNRDVNVKRAEFEDHLTAGLRRSKPRVAAKFDSLPRPLKEATLSVAAPTRPLTWARSLKNAAPEQTRVLQQFASAVELAEMRAHATTIGILDLGARVTDLAKLINRMNGAQDRMVFIEIQTPVPAGMIKTGQALVSELGRLLDRPLKAQEAAEVSRNMLVHEFISFGTSVQEQHELDALVGITPAMLAFEEDATVFWNYFSYGDGGPRSIVSTCDLRGYALEAGRPFEAAVGMLIVGQLLSNRTQLKFHEESRGCALDHNGDRIGLVQSIEAMRLDPQCAAALKRENSDEAEAAIAILKALKRMKVAKPRKDAKDD